MCLHVIKQIRWHPEKLCFNCTKSQCGFLVSDLQVHYRGTMNVSETGRTCQWWDIQEPHENYYNTPELNPDAGLETINYCRNPDGEQRAWCYTTDPKIR
jgi:hypothetical protein